MQIGFLKVTLSNNLLSIGTVFFLYQSVIKKNIAIIDEPNKRQTYFMISF